MFHLTMPGPCIGCNSRLNLIRIKTDCPPYKNTRLCMRCMDARIGELTSENKLYTDMLDKAIQNGLDVQREADLARLTSRNALEHVAQAVSCISEIATRNAERQSTS